MDRAKRGEEAGILSEGKGTAAGGGSITTKSMKWPSSRRCKGRDEQTDRQKQEGQDVCGGSVCVQQGQQRLSSSGSDISNN